LPSVSGFLLKEDLFFQDFLKKALFLNLSSSFQGAYQKAIIHKESELLVKQGISRFKIELSIHDYQDVQIS